MPTLRPSKKQHDKPPRESTQKIPRRGTVSVSKNQERKTIPPKSHGENRLPCLGLSKTGEEARQTFKKDTQAQCQNA